MNENTNLLPKEGTNTSSFKVAIISALAPVLLLAALIAGLVFVDEPRVREALIQALLYVVMPAILAGGAVGFQYVGKRGDLAVAKLETYTAINAPPSQPSAEVNINQSETREAAEG